MSEPYEVSIAKITDQAELQKLYDACHELAQRTEAELLPLQVQYCDLTQKVEELSRICTLARTKEKVIKEKLEATKALSTLVFKCWYQAGNDFFYPLHKNASNRVTGIRIERCDMMKWEEKSCRGKKFTGKEYWRVYQTTMSGADCEKFSRLAQTVLTGRNVEADLEEMRKRRSREHWSTAFGIVDSKVVLLDK